MSGASEPSPEARSLARMHHELACGPKASVGDRLSANGVRLIENVLYDARADTAGEPTTERLGVSPAGTRYGESMAVVVIGAGYVGLVTAVGLTAVRTVHLVDQDSARVETIASGAAPIWEPELVTNLSEALASGRLVLDASVDGALKGLTQALVFVAVGTPTESPTVDENG